jgi:hypothetical protein
MKAATSAKNRWGDPPLLVHGRPSLLAASALAIALVILLSAVGTLVLAGTLQGPWRVPGAALLLLLTLFLFATTPIVIVLAYVALCTCRIGTPARGRGLAWAALGLGYVALVCRLALAATQEWLANWALVALLVFGAVHVLMFAAESRFAKTMVTTLVIAGVFLSLLGPWIHYSRESARRLQCADRLRQIGMHLQESQDVSYLAPTAFWKEMENKQSSPAPYMQSLFDFIEPASNVYTQPAENQGNRQWRTPAWQVETKQRWEAPSVSPISP